jgi:hypothetical protein
MNKPILAIKCKGCGAVYFACALAYGVDEVASDTIKEAVSLGDEVFIAESVKLGVCECGSTQQEE